MGGCGGARTGAEACAGGVAAEDADGVVVGRPKEGTLNVCRFSASPPRTASNKLDVERLALGRFSSPSAARGATSVSVGFCIGL